jgi:hypothetical protein
MWSESGGGLAREKSKLAKVFKIPAQESAPKLGEKWPKCVKKLPMLKKNLLSVSLSGPETGPKGQKSPKMDEKAAQKSVQKRPKCIKIMPVEVHGSWDENV